MSETTEISWTDHTFNPWIGCARWSEGCRNCYAEAMAKRYGWAEWGAGKDRKVTSRAHWRKVLAWNRAALRDGVRRRVFCASLADVFEDHAQLASPRADLFRLIAGTPHLDWLLLTKRPENIVGMLPPDWGDGYPNVWLGTTVEDERVAHRIDTLRAVPAVVRFLSCEPLIGALDLRGRLDGISWVIAGGESGRGARPMHWDWPRAIRDACVDARIAFHFKQHGEWISRGILGRHTPLTMARGRCVVFPDGSVIADEDALGEALRAGRDFADGSWMERVGKSAAGRELDGRIWHEFPMPQHHLARSKA